MLKTIAVVAVMLFVGMLVQAAEENPMLKARVGDWAEYNLSTNDQNDLMVQTHKVIKKSEKEITLQSTLKPGKMSQESQANLPVEVRNGQTTVVTLPLNQPYKPEVLGAGSVQTKEIARGQETKYWNKNNPECSRH